MCLATASLIVTGLSVGMQAYGQHQAGKAAKQAASYNAQVAENNAKIAEQNAEYASRAGIAKAERESMKGRVAMGKIKTAQAASGIDSTFGSAVDVQVGAREANVLDVANVVQNAQLEMYGYRSQQGNFEAQAGLNRMRGDQAESAGNMGALSTLLSGAGSLGTKWAGMNAETDPYAGWTPGNSVGSANYEKAWGD
jgi:hypothetical protein